MRNRRRARAGFTLIELLVAISVLAVVAVLGWRGLDGIVRARVTLTNDLEQTRGMQLAFAQLQSDCARIANTADIAGHPPLVAEQGRLTLVRSVFAENQPSRVQVVAYRLADGVLMRRETVATRDLKELESLWQAVSNDTDRNQPVALQAGVTAISIRTWANDNAGWRVAGAPAGATPNPVNPAAGVAMLQGLEVSLQLSGRSSNLVKIFLLGAV